MDVEEISYFRIPIEIRRFYNDVFELYEQRGGVGKSKGIQFIIHTRDHNPPHVHARYDKYEISISLLDFSILVGNIPERNKNIAVKWVKQNKDMLLNYWENKTIVSSNLPFTKSMLDSKETIKI